MFRAEFCKAAAHRSLLWHQRGLLGPELCTEEPWSFADTQTLGGNDLLSPCNELSLDFPCFT